MKKRYLPIEVIHHRCVLKFFASNEEPNLVLEKYFYSVRKQELDEILPNFSTEDLSIGM